MAAGEEHKRKIAATLIGVGVPKKDAAKTVGVTPATISAWCKDADFQAICDKAAKDVIAGVIEAGKTATSLALAKIIELMGGRDKSIALRAAQDILDRFGLPKGLTQTIVQEGALPIIVYEAIDATTRRNQKEAPAQPDSDPE